MNSDAWILGAQPRSQRRVIKAFPSLIFQSNTTLELANYSTSRICQESWQQAILFATSYFKQVYQLLWLRNQSWKQADMNMFVFCLLRIFHHTDSLWKPWASLFHSTISSWKLSIASGWLVLQMARLIKTVRQAFQSNNQIHLFSSVHLFEVQIKVTNELVESVLPEEYIISSFYKNAVTFATVFFLESFPSSWPHTNCLFTDHILTRFTCSLSPILPLHFHPTLSLLFSSQWPVDKQQKQITKL